MPSQDFFFLSQILELDKLKFTNLTVENLFLSFESITPKYSGFIQDLDVQDLYFDEILNIGGEFLRSRKILKFTINSADSILKNYKQIFLPVSLGAGTL